MTLEYLRRGGLGRLDLVGQQDGSVREQGGPGVLDVLAAPAHAEHKLYALIAADVWPTPAAGLHGIGLVGWQAPDLIGDADFALVVNTDTVIARLDDVCALDGRLCAVAQLKGEYQLSGLLSDYYARGVRIDERGGFGVQFKRINAAMTDLLNERRDKEAFERDVPDAQIWVD